MCIFFQSNLVLVKEYSFLDKFDLTVIELPKLLFGILQVSVVNQISGMCNECPLKLIEVE